MSACIKVLARSILKRLGVLLYQMGLAEWVMRRSSRTRAVLYHAVESRSNSYTMGLGINVSPETFALHLEYYKQFYRVISMSDYLQSLSAGITPLSDSSKPSILITFDDGYASVMEHALPLLEQRDMPATVYLIGNAVRGRMVWVNRLNQALNEHPGAAREILDADPGYPGLNKRSRRDIIHYVQMHFEPAQIENLINRLETTVPELTNDAEKLFSSPDDIRQMQRRGIEFGFHSNDHYNLGKCKDSQLVETLDTGGLTELITSNTFAYPFGYFAPSSIGRLDRQGYDLLLTVGSNNDRFSSKHLDRTEMFELDFAAMFARLEVEEPLTAAAQSLLRRCIKRARGISRENLRRAV